VNGTRLVWLFIRVGVLFELTYRKHPRWGPELIEQMVHDYPSIESFARMLSRMEQGYRGFKGRGPSSR